MEPVKDHQGMKIIGIDNGYGNIKTANCCFPAGLTVHGAEPVFKDDLLVYDGRYYLIGTGHKEFKAATLPSLLVSKTGAKVDGLFELCKFFISFLFTFFVFHPSISDSQTHKKIRFLLLCTGIGYKLCIEKLKHSF